MENTENKCQQPPKFYTRTAWVYITCCLIFVCVSVMMMFDRSENRYQVHQMQTQLEVEMRRIETINEKIDIQRRMDTMLEKLDDIKRELEEMKQKE